MNRKQCVTESPASTEELVIQEMGGPTLANVETVLRALIARYGLLADVTPLATSLNLIDMSHS